MTIDKAKELGVTLTGNYHLDVAALIAEIERVEQRLHESQVRLSGTAAKSKRRIDRLREVCQHFEQRASRQKNKFEAMRDERDKLQAENEALRGAMHRVLEQVDGNIRETVRDCVNGHEDVQDIYGYCDSIEMIISEAKAKQVQP